MKKKHIFGIIVIGIAITVIITTAGDASSYVSFNEAKKMAENGVKNKIHVVGKLKKNTGNEIIGIESSPDRMSFKFIMVDENKKEQLVMHPNPIPQDFERSEQVVVVGSYHQDIFIAEKILLKCPSKYQEEEIKI